MAVVRRGRKEQAVLELRCDQAQSPAEFTVFPERRGHEVVTLVDDQEIPRQVRRPFGGTTGGEELLADVRLA